MKAVRWSTDCSCKDSVECVFPCQWPAGSGHKHVGRSAQRVFSVWLNNEGNNSGVKCAFTTVLFSLQKYYGRKSPVGRDVCRLRKAYYSARHEAAVQIDEIVGETASEADSSDSLERDHGHPQHGGGGPGSHDKDDDVIRCICGMYKDEGLMIQCEKCMVRGALLNINNWKKCVENLCFYEHLL